MKDNEVENVFKMHKRWIEEGLEQAKSYAADCDFKSMLQNFYRAALALKGLETVFTVDIPEVRVYIEQTKADITAKDIPELANILQQKIKSSQR